MKHFAAEGDSKRIIYAILKSGTIEKESGKGRKAVIMIIKINKN